MAGKKNRNLTSEDGMDFKIEEAMAKIVEDTVGNDTIYDKKLRKKKKTIKITCIVLGVMLLILGAAYGGMTYYYSDRFFKGTSINHMNTANLTAAEVETLIADKVSEYSIELQFREEKSEDILGANISYEYVPDGSIQKLLDSQNPFAWITGYFKNNEYEIANTIEFSEDELRTQLDTLDAMSEENQTPPQDAHVVFQETEFVVAEEVQGTTINGDALFEALKGAVTSGATELSVEEAGAYEVPSVTKDDEGLSAQRDLFNTYAKASITYTFGEASELLDGSTIKDWLVTDEAGNITYDEAAFQESAKQYLVSLGEKYNTVGIDRTFYSTAAGADITVGGGSFGWKIDQAGELEQLLAEITSGTVTTRDPVYASTAVTREGNEIGNTYVEVDLGNQHLWFYVNGEVIVESDFVSGKASMKDRKTPAGVFSLYYKERNRVLRGTKQPDGSYEYESPVKYWMPFNGGIGLHDASWRGKFGGTIYQYSGSHGCINLPTSAAATIYENIEAGMPVVCFY